MSHARKIAQLASMILVAVGLLPGCSKKEPLPPLVIKSERPASQPSEPISPTPPPDQPPAPPVQPAAPVEVTTTDTASKPEATKDSEPGIAELNAALQAWTFRHNNPPKDFSELVKAGLLKKVPTPPGGRRYVLNPQTMSVSLQ